MESVDLLFLIISLLLAHAFWGYSKLLKLCLSYRFFYTRSVSSGEHEALRVSLSALPSVTVLLAVHNEELVIESRLTNLLNCVHDETNVQLLVCSDGSTDKTNELIKEYANRHPVIELVVSSERLGKTGVQNLALSQARGDVLVITDADTEFSSDCLEWLLAPFVDASVGGTTGALHFKGSNKGLQKGQLSYWSRELAVRECESRLGWLCVATGACMAIRKELYQPPSPQHGDDCVLPLDVVLSGYRMVHVKEAVAFDEMPCGIRSEFLARVRMTERNWTGTLSRARVLNPLQYPSYSFSLFSHKLLKWLSPLLFLLLLLIASWQAADSYFYMAVLLVFFVGLLGALLGGVADYFPGRLLKRIPIIDFLYGFMVANVGFALGGLKALVGVRTVKYSS